MPIKLRSLALAGASFVLGAAALFIVETKTLWLTRFQPRTDYRVTDTQAMQWVRGREESVSYDMKFLYKDPATRQTAMLLRYPAGQVNPDHIHTHGHAMYVLEGKLVTHKGTYGPGSFVWFPPHEVISHGATPGEDVVVLFIRHEDMETVHVRAPGP